MKIRLIGLLTGLLLVWALVYGIKLVSEVAKWISR